MEELLKTFPQNDKIDINVIKCMLENLFDNCNGYQDILDYFLTYVNSCFPGSDYNKYGYNTPEYKEHSHYLYGNDSMNFYDWIKLVQKYYLDNKGKKRTYEEACDIAANKWLELLFEFHLQDNGALNEDMSFKMSLLATSLKENARNEISEDIIKNVYDNIHEYYMNHCQYQVNEDYKTYVKLYCDYGPNAPLYDLLKKSGIEQFNISSLCPWKTGIEIDENDNSVVILGYQTRKYI